MPYDIIVGRSESDKKAFGDKGLIKVGKGYVHMGQYTSLSNPIWLDVARSHVILVAGKRGCLTEDTFVFTDKGYKKINDFDKKLDKVLSFNKDNKKFEWENADLLEYSIKNEELFEIELIDGRKIKLTKEHPLLSSDVKGNNLSWLKAIELKKGNFLLSVDKKDINKLIPIKINSIKKISGIKKVYDLSVDKNHSFIANGIISHNSGKSYTLGVIAEEISSLPEEVRQNIAPLIFDTMGIYWTMKYANEKEKHLLSEWDLKPQELPVKVFAPFGYFEDYQNRGIPVDEPFALKVSEMNAEDWILMFGLEMINPVSVLIQRVLFKLKQERENFDLLDVIDVLAQDKNSSVENKNAAIGLFEGAMTWGLFAMGKQKGTQIKDLLTAGTTSVLDLSAYNSVGAFNVRALIIGLVSRKLFNERMSARKAEEVEAVRHGVDYLSYQGKRKTPLVWILIDEAHEFLPRTGKTSATDALVQLLREGRQPGVSLVLATQQPGEIHKDVMTQSDVVISHRLTAAPDMEALNKIMQSYLLEGIKQSIDDLPNLKGSAIILDDNSERLYPMRVKPRFTWHGGEAPTAIKVEKRF